VAGGSNLATAELYGFPTVETDKSQYAPGDQVSITGSGWLPAESVTLSLVKSPSGQPVAPLYATADAMGNITAAYTISSSGPSGTYYLTAVRGTSNLQAQAMFRDATATLRWDGPKKPPPPSKPAITCTGFPDSVTYGIAPIAITCTSNSQAPLTATVTWPGVGNGTVQVVKGVQTIAGTIEIKGAGTVVVVFSQPALDNTFLAGEVTYKINVAKAQLTITAPNITLKYGVQFHASQFPPCTVQGLVNGDQPSPRPEVQIKGDKNTPLGTYSESTLCNVPTGAKLLADYAIKYVPGTLTIVANPNAITLSPSEGVVAFPATPVNALANGGPHEFTLTNRTGTDVTFTVSEPDSLFLVNPNLCLGTTGTTLTFQVKFVPTSAGPHTATVTITAQDAAGDPPVQKWVALRGTGIVEQKK